MVDDGCETVPRTGVVPVPKSGGWELIVLGLPIWPIGPRVRCAV